MTHPGEEPANDQQATRRGESGSDENGPRGAGEEGAVGASGTDAPTTVDAGGDDVRRQLDDQRDRYLRLAAEYDNFRRRTSKQNSEAGTRAQAELVKHIVEALDDISRFAHVDPATTDAATVVQGVDMVEKKLLKALGSAGLEVISPIDEPFDPAKHEAVATEPALSREDDHLVSRVYQPGYVFGGQLLRPARVVVKQWNG